jgi:RNA polymerase sigma factor (sigma-70 family)
MNIQQAVERYKETNDEQDLIVVVDLMRVYTYKELAKKQDKIETKSDLNFVIYKAIKSYDVSKFKFITFFWQCWFNHLGHTKAYKQTRKRNYGIQDYSLNIVLPNFDEEIGSYIPSKKNELERNMFDIEFSRLLSRINKKDAFIIMKLYEGFTIREIADHMNLSRQRVYERMMNLREDYRGKQLFELLKEFILQQTG